MRRCRFFTPLACVSGRHVNEGDSTTEFEKMVKGRFTSSKAEWEYLLEAQTTDEEIAEAQAAKKRVRWPLAVLKQAAASRNQQLQEAKHPPLEDEEIIAANMYSGPMFDKYNTVLRGLLSASSEYMHDRMVRLCCPPATAEKYAARTITLTEAKQTLNRYPTTIHGAPSLPRTASDLCVTHGPRRRTAINSCIIKLSKLSIATRVYRGVSGKALPRAFWEPNQYQVRGGVENGFMSCTEACTCTTPSPSLHDVYQRNCIARLDRSGTWRWDTPPSETTSSWAS